MAARKMTKTEEVKTDNKVEPIVTESTQVSIDADALIKSILNNVDTKDNSRSRSYVLCRSVTNGGLNINCKSGNTYEFKDYGTECEIEYDDLIALIRKHSSHIFNPRFIIEDDGILDEFPQVAKAYEHIYTLDELSELFTLPPSSMIATIKTMPKNVQYNLQSMIATKIADGSIDSVKTIRALSEFYNSDFNLLSELFS